MSITLDYPPVQSFHNITVNFRVHARVIFLVNGGERPLLMVCFLKRLETSPFRKRWFCRCAINKLCHAFRCTQNVFTNGTLIPIYLSACSFMETSEKLLLFHVFCASAEHFHKEVCIISVFCACTMRPKVTSVSSCTNALATLGKNRKGSVCCCCVS